MIEVLISTFVLSVGLLGMAGLQTTGMRSNLSAYHRSQATQLAYDMADRIRGNIDDASQMGASSYATITSPNDQPTCTAISGTCTSAQMAENDLAEWEGDMALLLPSGQGGISVDGLIYTVKVEWDDDRDGSVNSQDPNFEVSFQL